MTREKIENMMRNFWTRLEDLAAELEDNGIEVIDQCGEYTVVLDEENEDEEILIYTGNARNTIWIESVR